MGLTISKRERTALRNKAMLIFDVAFDSSYPTGGESLTAADVGMTRIEYVNAGSNSGYTFEYDYTNSKLKAFAQAIGTSLLSHSGADIKGSANTDGENTDQDAAPTNSAAVGAQSTVSTTWTTGTITHPGTGRNVCIVVENDSGGPLNLFEGVMTFSIAGTWRGAAQADTITFTSTAGNKAVANGKFRFKYGVKPFDTVTGITLDNVPADNLKISTGIGSKIGLPSDLATPAAADVIKIVKNAANLANTSIVDTTNMTVNLGTLTDNDDFTIVYKTNILSPAIASEVANTTDLSGLTAVKVMAVGF